MRDHPDGPDQDQGSAGLANPQGSNGCTILPGVYWILPLLHTKLLGNCTTPFGSYQEGNAVAMDKVTGGCVLHLEGAHVLWAGAYPAKL